LIVILHNEAERQRFAEKIETDAVRLLSAVSLLEASMVIESRHREAGARELDLLLLRAGIEVVAVDADQTRLAREAWRRYGNGRHAAAFNLGDCFSYALSKATGEPLLFKGSDFARTDVIAA
jgi:ribonuclease VapC